MGVYRIYQKLNEEKITTNYGKKGRYIPKDLYVELKRKKRCMYCKRKKKRYERFEIHHKIPISKGGKNTRKNLMAVCKTCHKILDKKYGKKRIRN